MAIMVTGGMTIAAGIGGNGRHVSRSELGLLWAPFRPARAFTEKRPKSKKAKFKNPRVGDHGGAVYHDLPLFF